MRAVPSAPNILFFYGLLDLKTLVYCFFKLRKEARRITKVVLEMP